MCMEKSPLTSTLEANPSGIQSVTGSAAHSGSSDRNPVGVVVIAAKEDNSETLNPQKWLIPVLVSKATDQLPPNRPLARLLLIHKSRSAPEACWSPTPPYFWRSLPGELGGELGFPP